MDNDAAWILAAEVVIVLITVLGVVFLATRGRLRVSNRLEIGDPKDAKDDTDDPRE